MLESNAKVNVTFTDAGSLLGDTGEWKVVDAKKASRPVVQSADHHGKPDTVYVSERKKFDPITMTRVMGKRDWDRKSTWINLNHEQVTITELVYDAGAVYGKGLVIKGVSTAVELPKRDRDSETGLANIILTVQPTGYTEA